MSVLKILRATKGLNTKIDPVRLRYSASSGVQELAVAVNVDIDDTGRLSRRKGFALKLPGSFHSLFCYHDTAVCVTGDALSVINADWTTTPLRNVAIGARMSYCPVDDKIYYANGFQVGYIRNRTSYAWTQGAYVGPTTCKEFSDPPIGSIVAYYNSRIYMAQGKILWYSEPFDYGRFNLHESFMSYESQIIMVRPVGNGIFVGTERMTHFVQGTNPAEGFNRFPVSDYPPIKYTDTTLHAKLVVNETGEPELELSADGDSALWISKEGICYGGPQGNFLNLTKHKLDMPNALTGSSFIFKEKFVGTLNP